MPLFLVVANQTLAGEALLRTIRSAMSWGASFHIVVPATGGEHQLPHDDKHPVTLAGQRLEKILTLLRAEGAHARGEVGDPDPFRAVSNAVGEHDIDEIILSTLPRGLSRWIDADLPERLRNAFKVPVTHVIVEIPQQPFTNSGDRPPPLFR